MKKKTVLEKLNKKSTNAINLVVATIENLRNTNKTIEEEQQKNHEVIINIQATNSSLDSLKNNNEKIIANFEGLLK